MIYRRHTGYGNGLIRERLMAGNFGTLFGMNVWMHGGVNGNGAGAG